MAWYLAPPYQGLSGRFTSYMLCSMENWADDLSPGFKFVKLSTLSTLFMCFVLDWLEELVSWYLRLRWFPFPWCRKMTGGRADVKRRWAGSQVSLVTWHNSACASEFRRVSRCIQSSKVMTSQKWFFWNYGFYSFLWNNLPEESSHAQKWLFSTLNSLDMGV